MHWSQVSYQRRTELMKWYILLRHFGTSEIPDTITTLHRCIIRRRHVHCGVRRKQTTTTLWVISRSRSIFLGRRRLTQILKILPVCRMLIRRLHRLGLYLGIRRSTHDGKRKWRFAASTTALLAIGTESCQRTCIICRRRWTEGIIPPICNAARSIHGRIISMYAPTQIGVNTLKNLKVWTATRRIQRQRRKGAMERIIWTTPRLKTLGIGRFGRCNGRSTEPLGNKDIIKR
mmetsp:Transcript_23525/g.35291  ORF Transcript_23525/g.35291 Transcript_23525/m.35291 type:complete len:232 (-) Transcript_23525:23-718(-)